MKILYDDTVNHCGSVLAHRGCIYAGPVRGTIAYCDTPNAETFFGCPHNDAKQLSHKNPDRRMLPERGDRCTKQIAWWHVRNKYAQHFEPLPVAPRRKHVVCSKSIKDLDDFGRAEQDSTVVEEHGKKETPTG